MLKFYFTLQYHRTIRWMREVGLHPALGIVLFGIVFICLSKLLFFKIETASWIYTIIAILMLVNLGSKERNDQLQSIFRKSDFRLIRILENSIAVLPFFIYECYEQAFYFGAFLIPVSVGLALFVNLPKIQRTIPTPFKKFPFEFIVGFRKSFLLIILAYLLIVKAVEVGNYNLSIFGLALLFFISMSYYTKPEDEYYCWIFSVGPKTFLLKKIVAGLFCVSLVTFPVLWLILICFPENSWITVAVQLMGYVYLISMILAKYSAFPGVLNIAHGIFYGCSILFPPLLVIIIPIFYIRAKRRLTTILGW